jgi:hypothetical protein
MSGVSIISKLDDKSKDIKHLKDVKDVKGGPLSMKHRHLRIEAHTPWIHTESQKIASLKVRA